MMRARRILLSCMIMTSLSAFNSHAAGMAKWFLHNNSIPTLAPEEVESKPIVLAVVNTDTWLVSLLDLRSPGTSGATCFDGKASMEVTQGSPLKINGKFVKFQYACMGSIGIMQPKSPEGKKYLNEIALSGSAMKISLGEGDDLTFPASDIKDMKLKVEEAKKAM